MYHLRYRASQLSKLLLIRIIRAGQLPLTTKRVDVGMKLVFADVVTNLNTVQIQSWVKSWISQRRVEEDCGMRMNRRHMYMCAR